jgi:hypothetical protein
MHWGNTRTPRPRKIAARFQVFPQIPIPASPKGNDGPTAPMTEERGDGGTALRAVGTYRTVPAGTWKPASPGQPARRPECSSIITVIEELPPLTA